MLSDPPDSNPGSYVRVLSADHLHLAASKYGDRGVGQWLTKIGNLGSESDPALDAAKTTRGRSIVRFNETSGGKWTVDVPAGSWMPKTAPDIQDPLYFHPSDAGLHVAVIGKQPYLQWRQKRDIKRDASSYRIYEEQSHKIQYFEPWQQGPQTEFFAFAPPGQDGEFKVAWITWYNDDDGWFYSPQACYFAGDSVYVPGKSLESGINMCKCYPNPDKNCVCDEAAWFGGGAIRLSAIKECNPESAAFKFAS